MMRKRLISMLSALAMVLTLVTLLPAGTLKALALTTGTGTKSDPYVISDYDVLRSYLNGLSNDIYIKLGDNISTSKNLDGNFLIVDSNETGAYTVHLDLCGKKIRRNSNTDDSQLFSIGNAALIIYDTSADKSGSISLDQGLSKSIFYVSDKGELVINKCNVTTDAHKIFNNHGHTVINGGTYTDTSNYSLIYNQGTFEINGGKFYGDSNAGGLIYTFSNAVTIIAGGKFVYTGTNSPNYNGYYFGGDPGFKLEAYAGEFSSPNVKARAVTKDAISNSSTIKIDGSTVTKSNFPSSLYNSLTLGCKLADKATINVIAPQHDGIPQKPSITDTQTFSDEIGYNWFDTANDGYSFENFIGGHTYRLEVTLNTKNNYIIGATPDFKCSVKNARITSYKKLTDTSCRVSFEMVCPKTVVSEVNAAISQPEGGKEINNWIDTTGIVGVTLYTDKLSANTRNRCTWYHGAELTNSGDKFVEGETYYARFTVEAREGYELASDITVRLNGIEATQQDFSTGNKRIYSVSFKIQSNLIEVNTISIKIGEPVAGHTIPPLLSVSEGSRWWALEWDDVSTGYSVDTIEAGKKYCAKICIGPDEGYRFGNDLTVTVNGKPATVVDFGKPSMHVECEFTVPGLKGDVNHDGEVDRIDANLLSRYVAGWDGYESRIYKDVADLNGDGNVDRIDANILSRCVADWDGYRDKYIK